MARPKLGEELKDDVMLGVRIERDTNEALESIAKRNGRTKSEEVREALENYVRADSKLKERKSSR